MRPRSELSDLLHAKIPSTVSIYFQPPPGTQIKYPALIYKRVELPIRSADNFPYKYDTGYELTYIDKKPDNDILQILMGFPMIRHVNSFISDNLNHDRFILYF